jgi:hypothetical protein
VDGVFTGGVVKVCDVVGLVLASSTCLKSLAGCVFKIRDVVGLVLASFTYLKTLKSDSC